MSAKRALRAAPSDAAVASFAVSPWMHRVGGWQERHPRAALRLGNFDTRVAAEAIADVAIDRPIYIAGLARSGTTMLLELAAEHADVATHQYRDFPPVFTPWLWDRWLARVPQAAETVRERAHGDGIAVTSRSPEAFEEMLWMAFFKNLHAPAHPAVLDADTAHPEFERFYQDHVRKMLAIRGGRRYAAKGNYNLTRLGYLHRLFPDARFVLAVRDPLWHIASLIKQQTLFEAGQAAHPRARDHLRRAGHFEFGRDRRPINVGDPDTLAQIQRLWQAGSDVEGWARYWAMLYADLADRLEANSGVREASLVLRFEDLCDAPETELRRFFRHCGLAIDDAGLGAAGARLHRPAYYAPDFSDAEIATIRAITAPVAARFGYDQAGAAP